MNRGTVFHKASLQTMLVRSANSLSMSLSFTASKLGRWWTKILFFSFASCSHFSVHTWAVITWKLKINQCFTGYISGPYWQVGSIKWTRRYDIWKNLCSSKRSLYWALIVLMLVPQKLMTIQSSKTLNKARPQRICVQNSSLLKVPLSRSVDRDLYLPPNIEMMFVANFFKVLKCKFLHAYCTSDN